MIKRTSFASVAIVLNCIAMPHGFAQDAKSPDIHVDLNEGIYLYLMGEEESTQYEEAIRVFSSVLDRDPDNVSALLFRALSHADLGLEDYRSRKGAEYLIRQYGFVLKTRQSGSDGTSYEKEIRALEEQIATYKALDVPDTETIAEWNEAIAKLAAEDVLAAELVKLRYFTGLSVEQAALSLEISRSTAYRHWTYARAWIRCEILGEPPVEKT